MHRASNFESPEMHMFPAEVKKVCLLVSALINKYPFQGHSCAVCVCVCVCACVNDIKQSYVSVDENVMGSQVSNRYFL